MSSSAVGVRTTTTRFSQAPCLWFRSGSPVAPKDYYFWDSVAKGLVCLLLVETVRKKTTTTAEIALPAEFMCCWVEAFCLRVFIIVEAAHAQGNT